MRMSGKEGSMTGDALTAAYLAKSTADQRRIGQAVAEITAQPLMNLTATDKG